LLVRTLSRRVKLDADDEAALAALAVTIRQLGAGQQLAWDGDRPRHCAFLLDGFTYRTKFSGEGRRQILAIGMKGDFIDLQNALLGVSDHNIELLSTGTIALFPVEAIRAAAIARPMLGLALWHETLVEASVFREWILNVGRRDAFARVAHLLCELALRLELAELGMHREYELPISQEQLADAVSLTSVHVNRTLMKLEHDGFISRSKRQITIRDWSKLIGIADFNDRYLHVGETPLQR
jgi:CRP-like cAMP-binding protein